MYEANAAFGKVLFGFIFGELIARSFHSSTNIYFMKIEALIDKVIQHISRSLWHLIGCQNVYKMLLIFYDFMNFTQYLWFLLLLNEVIIILFNSVDNIFLN